MKLKYDKPKGSRINRYFYGIAHLERDLWWVEGINKWLCWDDAIRFSKSETTSSHCPCKSIKAFKRRLKKFPKNIEFTLVSKYVGYDVYGINKRSED